MPLRVNEDIEIADDELVWTASRSGGPGGQNVNKVATRVTVLFDLAGSGSLSPAQKDAIRARLGSRVSREGVLRVVSQRHRTQPANRDAAFARLAELLRDALREPEPRVPTRPTAASRRRRLEEKTRRARIKQERRAPPE